MNSNQFSEALENISPPLIDSAAHAYDHPRPHRRRNRILRRIAAIAAVIAILMTALLWPSEENYITGPGVLVVRAHGVDDAGNATIKSDVLELGVQFLPDYVYNPQMSYRRDFPISFSLGEDMYPGMDVTLEINTNTGIFYKNIFHDFSFNHPSEAVQTIHNYYGQNFSINIDKTIYWQAFGFDYNYFKEQVKLGNEDFSQIYKPFTQPQNPSFIDVIIKANDLIVGYCIIEVREINGKTGSEARNFSFELVSTVSFPQVDGYWQNVTHKYVEEQINNIHKERGAKT